MAPKGEDESWFSSTNADLQSSRTDAISVRISNYAEDMLKRESSVAAGELSDVEQEYSGCCFPRGRVSSRKVNSESANLNGTPFSRLDDDEVKRRTLRSRAIGAVCCCCGPQVQPKYTVEVRAAGAKSIGVPKQEQGTIGRWEVDVNEEYYKPPIWKQLVMRVKAHAKQVHSQRDEWLNYDPHSYQMNFDDGCWREPCGAVLHFDENDDMRTRERAMHTALLKKFATSRSQQCPDGSPMSPILSPLPVKHMSREEIEKSKEGSVPIWQRRAAPPIKLDLRQRPGPQ